MIIYADAQVTLSLEAQRALFTDVCQRPQIEACGVLLGAIDELGNWLVAHVHPLQNIFDSPTYFEFSPEDLLKAELTYPEQIIGVYHSHPTGFAKASSTDRENMQRVNQQQQIPWVWLIIKGPFDSQFAQQTPELIPLQDIIAYYHSPIYGLQHIKIQAQSADSLS